MLLPNQHLGQVIIYAISIFEGGKQIWGLSLDPQSVFDKIASISIFSLSFFCNFVFPLYLDFSMETLLVMGVYWSGLGLGYFANVLPNHDLIDIHNDLESKKNIGQVDWGEWQLRASANHTTGKGFLPLLVTNLWGGMNYQIEHHLFPSVSHVHFPAISKYVEETAKEFNIPYRSLSYLESISQYQQLISEMAPKK